MTTKLTPGEFDALATILRCGGVVYSTMGRMRKSDRQSVRTTVLNKLGDKGFIRTWRAGHPHRMTSWSSREWSDIMVTAEGCNAYNEEQGRRILAG